MRNMSQKLVYSFNDEHYVDSSEEENDDDEESDNADEELDVNRNVVKKLEDLPWFHGNITRNTAGALLLQNGVEGMYLLRCSSSLPGKFSVSVKCQNSVKHYSLEYQPYTRSYVFGKAEFFSIEELIEHFKQKPVLSTETGIQITLKCAYMRHIEEPPAYVTVVRHSEGGIALDGAEESLLDLPIASKEGYLIKRGAIHKNWKKRWFILQKNILQYYKEKDCDEPIRSLDLKHAIAVCKDPIDDKEHCFSLQLPKRNFYFHASSASETSEWMKILQWKINYYTTGKGTL